MSTRHAADWCADVHVHLCIIGVLLQVESMMGDNQGQLSCVLYDVIQ